MRPELDQKLVRKYPKIFAQRHLPPSQTAMCWGFDCGDGWYDLLDTLCETIQDHIDWSNCDGRHEDARKWREPEADGTWVRVPQLEAAQVKEKFGGLRFYTNGGDDFTRGAINFAELLSLRVCETCGAPGRPQKGGWIRTLCPTHAEEAGYAPRAGGKEDEGEED